MGKGIASSVHGEVETRDPGGIAQRGGGRLHHTAHSKVRQQSPVVPPTSPQLFCACSAYVFLLTFLSSPTMKRKCPWVFSMGRKEVSMASALVSSNMCYNLTNPKALMDRRGGETGKGWFIWSWYICGMSRAKLGSLISTVAVTYFRWIAMERPISAPFIWRLPQCLAQGPVKN